MQESDPRSALEQLARLVPDASFAIARDLQRAALGAARFGIQCTAAAISAVAAEPAVVQLLEQVVEILPIDALLARVDLNALMQRVDLNALLARVDVEDLVGEVLAGIEIGDLIHDSTNSIASDVRDTVRSGAASVDGRMAGIVDRIVRRGRERDLVVPGYAVPVTP